MSPMGGVGINLAVQDAVAAARSLGPVLAGGRPDPAAVDRAAARVQRRRWWPTAATQAMQRILHRVVIGAVMGDDGRSRRSVTRRIPAPLRLIGRVPALQVIPARAIGVGFLPEHAPAFARRSRMPVPAAAHDAGAKNSSALPSGSVNESAQP